MSNDELYDEIEKNPPNPVNLDTVREAAKSLRDQYLQKTDLETRLTEVNKKIRTIEREELPELFGAAHITSITVESDGNLPGFIAERGTEYTAKIPEERKLEAMDWFEEHGHGDLVKSIITITFGMHEHEERQRVLDLLKANNIDYESSAGVHHMTLKAFVKHELMANRTIPMELLGAQVWNEVKIKKV